MFWMNLKWQYPTSNCLLINLEIKHIQNTMAERIINNRRKGGKLLWSRINKANICQKQKAISTHEAHGHKLKIKEHIVDARLFQNFGIITSSIISWPQFLCMLYYQKYFISYLIAGYSCPNHIILTAYIRQGVCWPLISTPKSDQQPNVHRQLLFPHLGEVLTCKDYIPYSWVVSLGSDWAYQYVFSPFFFFFAGTKKKEWSSMQSRALNLGSNLNKFPGFVSPQPPRISLARLTDMDTIGLDLGVKYM